MFGNRSYSRFFELCVPRELFSNWADCFTDHELSLRSAMAGDYVHIYGGRTSPADNVSIHKAKTINHRDEYIGQKFSMQPGTEKAFSEGLGGPTFQFLKHAIHQNLIPPEGLNLAMMKHLEDLSEISGEDPVLLMAADGGFVHPYRYKDFDEDTIIRKRGGLIPATIEGRPQFLGKSIIMPVKNKYNEMRFYFKNNLGRRVIKFVG